MTADEWYTKKRAEYSKRFGKPWKHLSWDDPRVYETMMRMAIEKRYFGLTNFDEDVSIANAVLIRDLVEAESQKTHLR